MSKATVPTDLEQKRLFAVAKSTNHAKRNAALLAVSYRLGFRAKEIAALSIKDVMSVDFRIKDSCFLRGDMTKGGKARVAYLSNVGLCAQLLAYLDERRACQGMLFNFDAPLFLSQKGGYFSPNTMQQLIGHLHRQAGIHNGRSHSGRRWFATELITKGIDIKSVSVLMGHSSVSMTAQYVQDNPQRLRRIAAELA